MSLLNLSVVLDIINHGVFSDKLGVGRLDGVTLPLKKWVCSLGVILDLQLSLDYKVAGRAKKAFVQL